MGDSHTSKSYFSNPQGESNGCPNKTNPYHQCRQYCKTRYGEQDIKILCPEAEEFIPAHQRLELEKQERRLKEALERQAQEEKVKKKILLGKKIALLKRKILDSWNQEKLKNENTLDGKDEKDSYEEVILEEDSSVSDNDDSASDNDDSASDNDDSASEDEDSYDSQKNILNDEHYSAEDNSKLNLMSKEEILQIEEDWNKELHAEYGRNRPDVMPSLNIPRRYTNQLKYLEETVLQAVQSFVWKSYQKDVFRSSKFNHPNKNPINLTVIKLRLQHNYYNCAKECIKDFNAVFSNCNLFYKETESYTGRIDIEKFWELEFIFLSKIFTMPKPEIILTHSKLNTIRKRVAESKIKECPKMPSLEQICFRIMAENKAKIPSNSQEQVGLTLDNLPEDEMKLIFSLLGKKDLKSLRLVSKRFAKYVILYESRMQNWNIYVIDEKQIYETLIKSKLTEYFPYLNFKLTRECGWTPKKIIKILRKQIVDLDVYISEFEEHYLEDISIPNLVKLRVEGHERVILQNKSISKTVKSLSVTNSEEFEEYEVENIFPELQNLCLKYGYMDYTWMISQNLCSLIILGQRTIDVGSLPILPNLKVLMVDYSSRKFIYKCAESLEFLGLFDDGWEIVEDDFLLSKLKHLVFGDNCYPLPTFVTRHKATLETLTIKDMFPDEEIDYEEIDDEEIVGDLGNHHQSNDNLLDEWINDLPSLQTMILPYEYKRKDKSGRVKVIYNVKNAIKILRHICSADYNIVDDEFIKSIFLDYEDYEDQDSFDDSDTDNDYFNSDIESEEYDSNSNFDGNSQESWNYSNSDIDDPYQ